MAGTGVTLLETGSERLLSAVRGLLEAKGIASTAEIAERIEVTIARPGTGRALWWRAPGPIPIIARCCRGRQQGGGKMLGIRCAELPR